MDLAQQGTLSHQGTRINTRLAAFVAVTVAITVALAFAIAISASVISTPSSDGSLGSDSWRAFRAEEQATARRGDPLAQQYLVDFRRSEHAEAPK